MNRFIGPIILILFIALFLIIGCGRENEKVVNDNRIPVKTEKVVQQKISLPIHTSGKISATTEAKLSFKIGGIIQKIFVREGQFVRKGTLLAQLDQSEIDANVEQAKNGFDKATRDFNRVQNLYNEKVVTLEQFQNAETGLNIARSNLQIAEFNQKHTKIYAPANGKILKKLSEENELTNAGYPLFFFGSENAGWILRVGVTDRDILKITIGDSATVVLDAYSNVKFDARVTEVGQSANPYNGTYEVEITLDSENYKIISGFIAKANIYPSLAADYYLVPIESINEADKTSGFVYSPEENNSVRKMLVTLGPIINGRVAVTSGLDGVKKVITSGSEYLTKESLIKVVN